MDDKLKIIFNEIKKYFNDNHFNYFFNGYEIDGYNFIKLYNKIKMYLNLKIITKLFEYNDINRNLIAIKYIIENMRFYRFGFQFIIFKKYLDLYNNLEKIIDIYYLNKYFTKFFELIVNHKYNTSIDNINKLLLILGFSTKYKNIEYDGKYINIYLNKYIKYLRIKFFNININKYIKIKKELYIKIGYIENYNENCLKKKIIIESKIFPSEIVDHIFNFI